MMSLEVLKATNAAGAVLCAPNKMCGLFQELGRCPVKCQPNNLIKERLWVDCLFNDMGRFGEG